LSNKRKVVKLICIVCPIGCEIEVIVENGNIISISGNKCPNGEKYAKEEVFHPKRLAFTVLRCKNGTMPTVAVKTSKPVSKFLIPSIMKYLSNVEVSAPLNVGDVVVQNILDSGADVIVTRSLDLLERNS
jgi:CxxC motif-containing protein